MADKVLFVLSSKVLPQIYRHPLLVKNIMVELSAEDENEAGMTYCSPQIARSWRAEIRNVICVIYLEMIAKAVQRLKVP